MDEVEELQCDLADESSSLNSTLNDIATEEKDLANEAKAEAEAEAAGVAATINDCAGNPQDPALLQDGICNEVDGVQIFNCAGLGTGLDFDAGACYQEVVVASSATVPAGVGPSGFINALALTSDLV